MSDEVKISEQEEVQDFEAMRLSREAEEKNEKLENHESLQGIEDLIKRIQILHPEAEPFNVVLNTLKTKNIFTLRDDSDGFGVFIDTWNLQKEKPTREQLIGVTFS